MPSGCSVPGPAYPGAGQATLERPGRHRGETSKQASLRACMLGPISLRVCVRPLGWRCGPTSCGASGRRLVMDRLHLASSSIRFQLVCRRPEVSQSTRSASVLTAWSTVCAWQATLAVGGGVSDGVWLCGWVRVGNRGFGAVWGLQVGVGWVVCVGRGRGCGVEWWRPPCVCLCVGGWGWGGGGVWGEHQHIPPDAALDTWLFSGSPEDMRLHNSPGTLQHRPPARKGLQPVRRHQV